MLYYSQIKIQIKYLKIDMIMYLVLQLAVYCIHLKSNMVAEFIEAQHLK